VWNRIAYVRDGRLRSNVTSTFIWSDFKKGYRISGAAFFSVKLLYWLSNDTRFKSVDSKEPCNRKADISSVTEL
jgi:hypothetical protein